MDPKLQEKMETIYFLQMLWELGVIYQNIWYQS